MKVAECGFARATWPNSERTRLSVKSERARASAYCDSVSRPWSRARVSASCLAGVSGGSRCGRGRRPRAGGEQEDDCELGEAHS